MDPKQIVEAIAKMDNQQIQQLCRMLVENGCGTQLEFHLSSEQLALDLDLDEEEL